MSTALHLRKPAGCYCEQVYVRAQSCPTLWPHELYSPPGSSVHGILQARTGVGCHALLQGIFLTQGSNLCFLHLLHWQADSLPLAPPGNENALKMLRKYPKRELNSMLKCKFIQRPAPSGIWLGTGRGMTARQGCVGHVESSSHEEGWG